MIPTGIFPILAPQPTGHPASLPQTPMKQPEIKRVAAADAGDTASDLRTSLRHPQDPPNTARLKKPASESDGDTAPPTLLQIKINTLLREQIEQTQKEGMGILPVSDDNTQSGDRKTAHQGNETAQDATSNDLSLEYEQAIPKASLPFREDDAPIVDVPQSGLSFRFPTEAAPPNISKRI